MSTANTNTNPTRPTAVTNSADPTNPANSTRAASPTKAAADILWNIPEQKTGTIAVLGGNSQNFAPVIKTAEVFTALPVKEVRTVLPSALQSKLPPLPNLTFAPATATGSFAKSPELTAALAQPDIALLAGDFSKNSATCLALSSAILDSPRPTIWAKDTTDLLAPEASALLEQGNITLLATLPQLQKLLRAIYYPKMLLLSMPIQPVKEVLHKFTLSYPVIIVTLHQDQILLVAQGQVHTTPLQKTTYTPLTLWTTDLAPKITALQLWNPSQRLAATLTALTWKP